MRVSTKGYAAQSAGEKMLPYNYETRELDANSIHIKILYCGVCHSDIHQVRGEWNASIFPMVPGHEIIGVVEQVGTSVQTFQKGDIAGVGYLVDSCMNCEKCEISEEQYCPKKVATFSDKFPDGEISFGGYALDIVVKERFAVNVPKTIDPAKAAPLLCAGATVYGAMKSYNLDRPKLNIAVVGLGGLGHLAVQYGRAWGSDVTVISSSESKREDAKSLGATNFLLSTDKEAWKRYEGKFDGIVDTASNPKSLDTYLSLLNVGGTLCLVGLPTYDTNHTFSPLPLVFNRLTVGGSLIAGMKLTQEMVNFSAQNNVLPWIEILSPDKCNEAHDRTVKQDVKYRFVLDMRRM